MSVRIEKDSLGEVEIKSGKYWGAQSQRSLENFKIGGEKMPERLLKSLVLIKKVAAKVNNRLGLLEDKVAQAILEASQEILEGKWLDHLPLVVWQTGSGTQTNMNVNEVLSNRAIELLGGVIGSKNPVHPNDHVNKGQSSNDTFPTAMQLATLEALKQDLFPILQLLMEALEYKSYTFKDLVKIGRTHLQDAVPMTLGQEFATYLTQIKFCYEALLDSIKRLNIIPQGGSALGTGLTVHPDFAEGVAEELTKELGYPIISAKNKFASIASHDLLVEVSGGLNTLATALMKIANDIRLLASGPRCGLGELLLPEKEPGSSIMPGKVNPTQCEALTMVCAQVMGNHVTITISNSHGHLQLNAFKPVIIYNLLQSIRLLSDAIRSFTENCLTGLEANEARVEQFLENSLMLVTALNPVIGYDKAAELAKYAYHKGISLREAAKETGIISLETFDKTVIPRNMIA
jgi:fumarate hydratase class II